MKYWGIKLQNCNENAITSATRKQKKNCLWLSNKRKKTYMIKKKEIGQENEIKAEKNNRLSVNRVIEYLTKIV